MQSQLNPDIADDQPIGSKNQCMCAAFDLMQCSQRQRRLAHSVCMSPGCKTHRIQSRHESGETSIVLQADVGVIVQGVLLPVVLKVVPRLWVLHTHRL